MDEADLSRMNDIELQKEYGRMKARLSKDGGRDPEGYRRLEAVSEEMDRRRRAVREEYFRDLREETGPLSPWAWSATYAAAPWSSSTTS